MTTAVSFVFILQCMYLISVLCIFTLQSTIQHQSRRIFFVGHLTLVDESTVLSQNVGYLSPSGATPYPRRMEISNRE